MQNSATQAKSGRRPEVRNPKAMGELSVLPVFFDLNGRKVIVAGATDAAEWKAELMMAAGADVVRLGDNIIWSATDLEGCTIAIADAESDDDAACFAKIARAAGVPVNIIDKLPFCDFSFGSIVNRSPVVVGISTSGTSPVIGQAVRRRIETLLPSGLARWAEAAGLARARIGQALKDAAARRLFWREIAERAFADPENEDPDAAMDPARLSLGDGAEGGKVTLVGAGPGDAELLTLKAVRALQAADVILYDDLVSDDVLELARREAKRMLVGKRGNRPSCRQEDINALMVKLASQGKHVVRLKAGDPMIFGRAGEELSELRQNGIPVNVIPGITAAVAAASSMGVSLTHRDCARSVRFVTGHGRAGGLPAELDWQGLADPVTTLMVYMGGRTASMLAERLIKAGRAPGTPVVAVSDVSRATENRMSMTLASLSETATLIDDAPVLIGIGDVFAAVSEEWQTPQIATVAVGAS